MKKISIIVLMLFMTINTYAVYIATYCGSCIYKNKVNGNVYLKVQYSNHPAWPMLTNIIQH